MHRFTAFTALALVVGSSVPAQAQVLKQPEQVIVSKDGAMTAPWKRGRICSADILAACRQILVNPQTREIAQVDGKLSTRFEATGKGQEIRRVKSTSFKK